MSLQVSQLWRAYVKWLESVPSHLIINTFSSNLWHVSFRKYKLVQISPDQVERCCLKIWAQLTGIVFSTFQLRLIRLKWFALSALPPYREQFASSTVSGAMNIYLLIFILGKRKPNNRRDAYLTFFSRKLVEERFLSEYWCQWSPVSPQWVFMWSTISSIIVTWKFNPRGLKVACRHPGSMNSASPWAESQTNLFCIHDAP